MQVLDNVNRLFGEDLKATITPNAKLKIAASCFSIYAYAVLKKELEAINSLEFIFTSPTFVPEQATDKLKKQQREFYIPQINRENSLYGSEFEIHLRNQLTQRAIAKECADWIRSKVTFKSNKTQAPMQQFAHVQANESSVAYIPLWTWGIKKAMRFLTSSTAWGMITLRNNTSACLTAFGKTSNSLKM